MGRMGRMIRMGMGMGSGAVFAWDANPGRVAMGRKRDGSDSSSSGRKKSGRMVHGEKYSVLFMRMQAQS